MVCQKKHFRRLLLSCVVLASFSGCATKIPVTKEILNHFSFPENPVYSEGPGKPEVEFIQYYLSKKITLRLNETNYPLMLRGGMLIETEMIVRKRITLRGSLPGTVRPPVTDGKGNLIVGFENDRRYCFIKFGQLPATGNENYYLLYDEDTQTPKIIYDGHNYDVIFEGDERPYLVIKMKKGRDKNQETRYAKGWRLGE